MSLIQYIPAYENHTPVFLSDNPITAFQDVADDVASIRMDLFTRLPGEQEPRPIVQLRADPYQGTAVFHLDEITRRIPFQLTAPPVSEHQVLRMDGHIQIVSYQTVVLEATTAMLEMAIIKGGSTDLENSDISTRKFRTLSPLASLGAKPVHVTQPDWIYWLDHLQNRPGAVRVMLNMLFEDGTEQLMTPFTIEADTPLAMYCIPSGPLNLRIPAGVVSYEIALVNAQDRRITEARQYVVDRTDYEGLDIVLFQNSLGVFETLYFFGNDERSASYDVDRARRPLNYVGRQGIDLQITSRRNFVFRTGHYPRGWNKAFGELLHSTDVYLVENNRLIPLQQDMEEFVYRSRTNREDIGELKFTESQNRLFESW